MWFPPTRPAESRIPTGRSRPAALFLAAFLAASCMNDAGDEAYLRLEADPVLMTYGRVIILMGDTLGNAQDTLYDDTLPSMARLHRLPAGSYRGGVVRITILGYRGGASAYRETRVYDGASQSSISVEVLKQEDGQVPGPIPDPVATGAKAGKAPVFDTRAGDTAVSIGDSVMLDYEASDPDGDLDGYAWDCGGLSKGSAALSGYRAKFRLRLRFADSGGRACEVRIRDKEGKSALAGAGIKVEQDPPWADAGADTTVIPGTLIRLHARGADGMGPIVTREWKMGSLDFAHVTRQETSYPAPITPGDLVCILRVMDSDSLTALDTMVVKIILPE